jgi:hypothetical protein
MRQDQEQATVTPLELFFDLVFVFALTQVTAFMADELSWHGILRGALVMMRSRPTTAGWPVLPAPRNDPSSWSS